MGANEIMSAFDALQAACRILELNQAHDIAAVTSHAMALITERFGVGADHISDRAS